MTDHDSPSCPQLASNAFIAESSESCCNGPDGGPPAPSYAMCDRAVAAASTPNTNNNININMDMETNNYQIILHPLFAHSSSMEFNLIREEDADILEQGVEEKRGADLADFDDDGRRLKASESNASLTEFENEAVAAEQEELDSSSRSQRSGDGLIAGNIIDESSNELSPSYASSSLACPLPPLHTPSRKYFNSAASSNDTISMPAIAEDWSFHTPHDPAADADNSRPQSNIIDVEQLELETLSENNDYFIGSSSPESPPKPQIMEIDHEALARRRASGRSQHRSDSFDRRMFESAQFAEAVGEKPDSLLVKKIIEEDSASDFDDDDIDEGVTNFVLHEEDQVENLLVHHTEVLQNSDGQTEDIATEQLAGAPSQEKIDPSCVLTDLAQMSLKEEECSNQPLSQEQGELPQLSTTLEVVTVDSAPTTPAPSPRNPSTMMTPVHTPMATSFHPPCYVDWKFHRQHSSGSNLDGSNTRHKSGGLASSSGEAYFGYRGIRANPPEITKRGMARGNYAQLHRKAWLEVSDKYHRYGKNLRTYYKHWEALGHPFRMFFDWLDSKGEAMGSPLPNLPETPRPVLDSDTVLYITDPEISANYALGIVADPADGSGIIVDQNGNPINTGKEGWIFILRDHVLYGSQKVTAPNKPTAGGSNGASPAAVATGKLRQRFHHSSFFAGKAVASAGIFITNEQGRLIRLYPHSGHYRPGEAHMQRALFFFQQFGVELSTFTVDMQQIFKVSRKTAPGAASGEKVKGNKKKDKENNATIENGNHLQINGLGQHGPQNTKKSKKTDSLHLMGGLEVACFLAHKALMIKNGVFHQIQKIRRIPKESRSSVCFILSFVNN
eukprot:CAMPEP_0201959490 /NCGR_PEP_ID=MMETSP0904-20121228/6413_1 /ASSEMBLY_ACC=CAM_ASM_000553 /TAXON_ID=420261 /ORGANISM="Thalassiosira antarctica, Strain CCMP982" /LENGTH=842 /DNA_ID=CAMNT_0048505157 /DNA_START=48 /DNA_END=2576 /DNA_ORIENTATION=-